MIKFLKILLLTLLLLAIAAGIVWMVLVRNYPWWVGAALALGLCGIWLGIVFLRRYLQRRNEKEFVRRVISQDEEFIKAAPPEEKPQLMDLQAKWKESVELLRNSYLRKQGNPLYVLPWFLIIGESGAGKTSAVRNTRLHSPIGEENLTAGISVTRNCDWWFFEEAIILDTAGRYTIPVDAGVDREEWERFLALLAKYRRREPINGIIVTIAADKLQEMDEAKLGDEGQSVRMRVDQIMRTLGARIPIYVLVTKIDLIPGMLEFSALLPPEGRDQAMGFVSEDFDTGWKKVLDDSVSAVSERLKDLQFILVHRGENPEPEIFLFPPAFERLRQGLRIFTRSIFESNPYQATPMLRGVFFSSAIQEGKARAEFTSFIGDGETEEQSVIRHSGLFLRDFFKTILPRDRNLFIPIPEFLRSRNVVRNTGILAWALLWICLCGVLSFSYFTAKGALAAAGGNAWRPPVMTGRLPQDLLAIEQLSERIKTVERINHRWPLPVAGFGQGREAESRLKDQYARRFRENLLQPFESRLVSGLAAVPLDSLDETRLNSFGCLVARIGFLQEYVGKKEFQSFEKFRDLAGGLLVSADSSLTTGVASLFGDSYLDYLRWSGDIPEARRELAVLQRMLDKQMRNEEDLRWAALNWIEESDPVLLKDYWGDLGASEYDESITVPGIYTAESSAQMDAFFDVLQNTVSDVKGLTRARQDFREWYQGQYYEAWSNFSLSFPEDGANLRGASDSRQMIASMTSEENPYFDLLDRMAEEMKTVPIVAQEPSWVSLVRELSEARKAAYMVSHKNDLTLMEKLGNRKDQLVQKTVGKADKAQARENKRIQAAGKIWNEYIVALDQIASVLSAPDACFKAVSDYNTDAGKAASPFTVAYNRFVRLQGLLRHEDAPFIWDLIIGPQRFLLEYATAQAAGVLQQRWEEEVLSGTRGVDKDALPRVLFDEKEGLVWKFVAGTGKPFISSNQLGFCAPAESEARIPLREEFFGFLNTGPKSIVTYEPSYVVTMETLPVEVNSGARVKPYGCVFTLQCAEKNTALENYNYPQKQVFEWMPDKCGEVVLTILFTDLKLTRAYEGKLGFAEFLADFPSGSRTFRAEDFPRQREALEKLGISTIRVSYKISGGRAVARLLERNPSRIPLQIVGGI